MESVGSNSPGAAEHVDDRLTERIIRALSHRLALLHRSDPHFYVLGATGNVYTVTVSAAGNACTCPDRAVPCKHILFVLLRALGLPLDDPCLGAAPFRDSSCLLSLPTAPDALAGARARERFHQVFGRVGSGGGGGVGGRRIEEGEVCPVCLEGMVAGGGDVVSCGTCGNSLHVECFKRWRRSRGRRAASCVVCRAKWRESREVERYINLSVYVGEEGGGGGRGLHFSFSSSFVNQCWYQVMTCSAKYVIEKNKRDNYLEHRTDVEEQTGEGTREMIWS